MKRWDVGYGGKEERVREDEGKRTLNLMDLESGRGCPSEGNEKHVDGREGQRRSDNTL